MKIVSFKKSNYEKDIFFNIAYTALYTEGAV